MTRGACSASSADVGRALSRIRRALKAGALRPLCSGGRPWDSQRVGQEDSVAGPGQGAGSLSRLRLRNPQHLCRFAASRGESRSPRFSCPGSGGRRVAACGHPCPAYGARGPYPPGRGLRRCRVGTSVTRPALCSPAVCAPDARAVKPKETARLPGPSGRPCSLHSEPAQGAVVPPLSGSFRSG